MPVQVFPDIFSVEMFTLYMYDLIGQTHGRSVDLLPYFPVLYTLQMVAAMHILLKITFNYNFSSYKII